MFSLKKNVGGILQKFSSIKRKKNILSYWWWFSGQNVLRVGTNLSNLIIVQMFRLIDAAKINHSIVYLEFLNIYICRMVCIHLLVYARHILYSILDMRRPVYFKIKSGLFHKVISITLAVSFRIFVDMAALKRKNSQNFNRCCARESFDI